MTWAYYNEIDPYCATWLRNLIAAGLIPAGEVDTRDIREVAGDDLEGFAQVHLFAGIGGWAYAARLAGWPDDRPLWTGSCPCQPLSSAGQRKGHADERHLWPAFYALLDERRPAIVFGEQVAGRDGREWLAGVRADMEHLGYAVGAADLPAAGVGAPHIRQRLWWVAHAQGATPGAGHGFRRRQPDARPGRGLGDAALGRERAHEGESRSGDEPQEPARGSGSLGRPGGLVDTHGAGPQPGRQAAAPGGHGGSAVPAGGAGGLGDARCLQRDRGISGPGEGAEADRVRPPSSQPVGPSALGGLGDTARAGLAQREQLAGIHGAPLGAGRGEAALQTGPWSAFDLVPCADGKARRVEPGTFPLAHGVPARVGQLRAYGNAINPVLGAAFMRACATGWEAAARDEQAPVGSEGEAP